MTYRDEDDEVFVVVFKWIFRVLLLAIPVLIGATCCSSVDTGHVGVVKHFGAIQPYTLPEGVTLTRPWPFADVDEVSTQTGSTGHDAAAASKDLQTVHTKVTVQWSTPERGIVCMVQKFGNYPGSWTGGIMEPAILETVKAVSARYTAEQLITQRAEVHKGIEDGLNAFIAKTLGDRSCAGGVRISNVAVTNFDFSHEFNASIEAKVKAEQDALRAKNEKLTAVTRAESKAQELKLAADANAYQTEVESKSRAAAIERESKALESNPNLVQLRVAERWNGVLPTYTGGGSVPLLQLPGPKP